MQICRFDNDRLGLVECDTVRDVTAALDILPRHGYPLPRHDPLVANLTALRPRIESLAAAAPRRAETSYPRRRVSSNSLIRVAAGSLGSRLRGSDE